MAKPECAVCALPDHIRTTVEGADDTTGRTAAAQAATAAGHPITDYAVRVHRKHRQAAPRTDHGPVTAQTGTPEDYKPHVEIGPEGGTIATGALTEPLKDPADALQLLNVDPDVWELVGDTIRISRWQTPYRDSDGEMTARWSHALRANIRRRTGTVITDADLDELRRTLHRKPSAEKAQPKGLGTLVIALADLQLGKSEGGGVAATVERYREALDRIALRAAYLRQQGAIGRILIAQMGDVTEGVCGNYASQTYTVEINQRQQILLALDLLTEAIKVCAEIAPTTFLTVHSNHGEWSRNGGSKPITGDSDTVDGFLGDALTRLFADWDNVDFITPHDEAVVTTTAGGVPVAFSHGHKASGGMEKWIDNQTRVLTYREGVQPRLWITAHYHHLRVQDQGPYWWMQCPALDGGSKWFTDSAGRWSTPGVLTFVATEQDPRGWNYLAIL